MHPSLVSIVLCTYNGEKFLSQQLDSILAQSYRNIEIIIVDDCSTDNTWKILEIYSVRDNRIKCFKNEFNLGFNKNFEKALLLASGEYIAISDQDDIWNLLKVEKLLRSIADKWVVFSNSYMIDEAGNEIKGTILPEFSIEKIDYKSILLENFVTGHTVLMSREFLQFYLPIPSEGYYDWYMGFIALYHNKITYLAEALTYYRVHCESVIQQERLKNSSRIDKKRLHYNLIVNHLKPISFYQYLNVVDKRFIVSLLNAFEEKKEKFSFFLFKIIMSNYRQLFVIKKPRWGLSLINFSYKFSKRIPLQG